MIIPVLKFGLQASFQRAGPLVRYHEATFGFLYSVALLETREGQSLGVHDLFLFTSPIFFFPVVNSGVQHMAAVLNNTHCISSLKESEKSK